MVKPIALCLERNTADDDSRYVRCTAKPGRDAGLTIGLDGSIRWCDASACACEIWVAHDQRLVALRPKASPSIVIERAGRSLTVPEEHAVYLLQGDVLSLGAFQFTVHVHGVTDQVEPPHPLRIARGVAVASALALSLGCGAMADDSTPASGGSPSVENSTAPIDATGGALGTGGVPGFTFSVPTGGASSDAGDAASGGQTIIVVPSPPA